MYFIIFKLVCQYFRGKFAGKELFLTGKFFYIVVYIQYFFQIHICGRKEMMKYESLFDKQKRRREWQKRNSQD